MKTFFLYCLAITLLIIGATSITNEKNYCNIPKKDVSISLCKYPIRSAQIQNADNQYSLFGEIQTSNSDCSVTKLTKKLQFKFSFQIYHTILIVNQKILSANSFHKEDSAQKQLNGYYLYQLLKLII